MLVKKATVGRKYNEILLRYYITNTHFDFR